MLVSFHFHRAEARGLDEGRRQPYPVRRGLREEQWIPQVWRRGDLHYWLEEGCRILQHYQDPDHSVKKVINAEQSSIRSRFKRYFKDVNSKLLA